MRPYRLKLFKTFCLRLFWLLRFIIDRLHLRLHQGVLKLMDGFYKQQGGRACVEKFATQYKLSGMVANLRRQIIPLITVINQGL